LEQTSADAYPAEFIVCTPYYGQLAPGSATLFYLFTAGSSPSVVLSSIPGAILRNTGTIYLPDGTYNLSASFAAACASSTVAVAGIMTVVALDFNLGFNCLYYGEATQVLNNLTGYYQVYQNFSDIMWNTVIYGNNLSMYTSLGYSGGAACICHATIFITALVGPVSIGMEKVLRLISQRKYTEAETKTDCESKHSLVTARERGFVRPSITISDEEYVRVSPQTASISIQSAKRDIILTSEDFLG